MERPFRCAVCERIFYAEADRGDTPNCPGDVGVLTSDYDGSRCERFGERACTGTGLFAGVDTICHWGDTTSVRLNEQHMWETDGMYNPHAVPLRDTPMYARFVREGRIVMHDGKPCLRTANRREYNNALKEMGYTNAVGDGEYSAARQADQKDRRCHE